MGERDSTQLPVELWRQIICLATGPHDEIDISPKSPFTPQRDDDISRLPRKRRQMADKIAFSVVSKGWREVATEYLFESITVDVDRIPDRINRYDPFLASDRSSSPFRYVQCLEVYSSWHYASWTPHQPAEEYFGPLERLFSYCPKLVVFKHHLNYTPHSVFVAFLNGCGGSVRSIDLGSDYSLPRDLFTLLTEKTTHLEHLAIRSRDNIFHPSLVNLPHLHTFVIRNLQRNVYIPVVSWLLPRLEYLSWSHSYRDTTRSTTALQSFPRHIKVLDIQSYMMRRVQEVLEVFPMLEEVFLRLDFAVWVNLTGCYPCLRRVGILLDTEHHGQRKRFIQASFEALANRELFPSVSHIHLYGVTPSTDKRNAGWWQRWMQDLQLRGIQVMDFRGAHLSLASDEVV